jgi:polar amino acid transport system substrate-binding protein
MQMATISNPKGIMGGLFSLILAFGMLVIASATPGAAAESTLAATKSSKVLRAGYELFPPFVSQDPNTQSVSGFSVDLMNMIAEEAGWKVEWIKTAPDTKISDLKGGKFDVVATPIFQSIQRAREVMYTRPYVYIGSATGIVRKGDTRFKSISDLNKPGVTVVVRQGLVDQSYAEKNLPNATVVAMRVDDVSLIVLEVLSGKADIAIADTSQMRAFQKAHSDQAELVFTDPPPIIFPAGFIVRHEDFEMVNFLNASLDLLEINGVLDDLARKHQADAYTIKRSFTALGGGDAD